MKKKILIVILIVFIVIQFIRPEKNLGQADTPTDVTHYIHVPDSVMHILKASCYDCHSNHTNDIWYRNIMPIGWWLNKHVKSGKKHLNFSDFSVYDKAKIDKKLKETAEEVEKKDMPLASYTLIHRKEKLSDEQIKLIVDWTNSERKKLNQYNNINFFTYFHPTNPRYCKVPEQLTTIPPPICATLWHLHWGYLQ